MANAPVVLWEALALNFTCTALPLSHTRQQPPPATAHAKHLDDCDEQLICISGRCNDDPDITWAHTHVAGVGAHRQPPPPPAADICKPSGSLACKGNERKEEQRKGILELSKRTNTAAS